jgi:GTP-binding protein HflX
VVFNKADLISEDDQIRLRGLIPGSLLVSARSGLGIEDLERAISVGLPQPDLKFSGVIPYHRGDLISRAHLAGKVLETEYLEQGTRVVAMVSADLFAELEAARQP